MARDVDLLIVGSGPVGATYARLVAESRPATSMLMVDLGPRLLDPREGNIYNYRSTALLEQEAGTEPASRGQEAGSPSPAISGLYLLGSAALPEAAMASCVGGMGLFWGGATPSPAQTERVPFIDDEAWAPALTTAERLLGTTHGVFADSAGGQAIRRTLADVFGSLLSRSGRWALRPSRTDGTGTGRCG